MKKFWLIGLLGLLLGCSTAQVEQFVKDPHYAHHRQSMEELEHAYLRKEISFPEYQEKRKELEDQYSHEVQDREAKIHGDAF